MDRSQQEATGRWRSESHRHRCNTVSRAAAEIAAAGSRLCELCRSDQRSDPVETITAELMPLCSAMRHLRRRGAKVLRDRRCGTHHRPVWLWGVKSVVRRVPHGRVLILGTWNYPLFLPGVQAAQALAAGNQVLWKPAPGSEAATTELIECFHRGGVPRDLIHQLDSSAEAAVAEIEAGVDLITLTGSAETGRKVLAAAASTLTPAIMELSGCDAAVVLPGADLQRAAEAITFGLRFNSGATCIAPRRVITTVGQRESLVAELEKRLAGSDEVHVHSAAISNVADTIEAAIASGAVDRLGHFDADHLRTSGTTRPILLVDVTPEAPIASADLFAPLASLIAVDEIDDSVNLINRSPYRLAASVFGETDQATQLGQSLDVGTVTINDLIVPTADPRLPFGGRGDSGFGVTRGDEGLLAMTAPAVISVRKGKFLPHLQPKKSTDEATLLSALRMMHAGSFGQRWQALRQMIAARDSAVPIQSGSDLTPPATQYNALSKENASK